MPVETLEQQKEKLIALKALEVKPLNILIAIHYLEMIIERESKKLNNGNS